MKQSAKIAMYLGIVLLFILAIFAYNKFFGKNAFDDKTAPGKNTENRSGDKKRGGKSLPVSVYVASLQSGENGLMRLGTLVANEKVDLVSELSGRVVEINFKEGQFLRKGDILVKLNDDELQTQLTRAQYQIKLLEQRLERQKILLEKDAVSREDYDKVLTEYNVLRQDIEELKIRIGKMKVRAPFNGVVGFRDVSNGAFLQPGSKVSTMVDVANLKLEFSIPEKYATSNLIGKTASFTVEGLENNFGALIYAVDPQIDVNTRTVMIRARYNNNKGLLKPGMSARVSILTNSNKSNIYVPNQAVVPDSKGRFVWVMKNGKAEKVNITTGYRTTEQLEVLAGIQVGDTIITTGMMQLREGMDVNVVEN